MSSERTRTLLAWSAENRIQIDSRLEIVDTVDERGFSVYSRDELIECDCTLVYIPKTAVLSVKACFFSQHMSSFPCGHGAHLSLALALYGELLRGTRSRWFGYIQSLPRETVDIALFWGFDNVIDTQECTCSSRGRCQDERRCPWCVRLQDTQAAREWLHVTEVDREQLGLMEEIRQYYKEVVQPTFRAVHLGDAKVSFPGYCYAYSLVSTRAFWVDAYHGLAMVPIADAFNHTNDNHVQMESDYDVCVECGSLAECEHDRETGGSTVPANVHVLSHDASTSRVVDYLEMRTVRAIPPSSQVWNTYGALPNAALLSRYGFTLAENEHDTVGMVLDPLSTVRTLLKHIGLGAVVEEHDYAVTEDIRNAIRVGGQGIVNNETMSVDSMGVGKAAVGPSVIHSSEANAWENRLLSAFAYVTGVWNSDPTWDEDDDWLVFNPQPTLTGPVCLTVGDASVRISHDMVINADGRISHNLWLLCILIALFAARMHYGASFEDLMERAQGGAEAITSLTEFKARLINVQGYVERLRHIHDDDGDSTEREMEGGGNHGSTSPPPLLHQAPLSLGLDDDTESVQLVATGWAQARQAGCRMNSITAASGSGHASRARSETKATLDPDMNMSFSPVSQPSSKSCRLMPQATGDSNQEASASWMSPYVDRRTGGRCQHDRNPSAEGERPLKRVRRCSDPVVANRESWEIDRLGKYTPDSVREVVDTSDEDEVTHRLAVLLARTVVGLCEDRYRPPTVSQEDRGVGKSAAELGEMLDVSVFN